MLRPVEGLTFPHRVGILSPQGRYSELVSVYLVSFLLVVACRISPQARYSRGALWPLLHLPRGMSLEQGLGIAVDGEGRAYVTGSTSSPSRAETPS